MKIKVIAVGKIKEKFFSEAIKEYQKRISAYANLEIIEVNDEPILAANSEKLCQNIKEQEGQRILQHIKQTEYVIVLDLQEAKSYTSIELAKHFDELLTRGHSSITFVIGGSLGLGENIRQRANERLLLSPLTFTHQLARIILLEQVYRMFKINNHETYHK